LYFSRVRDRRFGGPNKQHIRNVGKHLRNSHDGNVVTTVTAVCLANFVWL